MRSVAPRVGFPETTLAENQLEYVPLTVAHMTYEDGTRGILTRWKFTDEERAAIAAGADLYLGLLTFGQPMQPINIEVGRPVWAPEEG